MITSTIVSLRAYLGVKAGRKRQGELGRTPAGPPAQEKQIELREAEAYNDREFVHEEKG